MIAKKNYNLSEDILYFALLCLSELSQMRQQVLSLYQQCTIWLEAIMWNYGNNTCILYYMGIRERQSCTVFLFIFNIKVSFLLGTMCCLFVLVLCPQCRWCIDSNNRQIWCVILLIRSYVKTAYISDLDFSKCTS